MRKFRVVLVSALIIFIAMQFFQPAKNRNSSESSQGNITTVYHIPTDVQTILKVACYDCHSNNTRYPWYVNIQPVGWFMAGHIKHGKEELNLDEYRTYSAKRQRNKMKRMKEQVMEGKMPLSSYTLIHRNAKLTTIQKELIAKWIDSTLNIAGTDNLH
ncbi:heme-binding domain-containing protein [Chitinophaga sancti]|uniref:Haem-binding domain-containing protein n=1 Tax=Chitinophaga sancti TaxID=1004 RepID=A0A1K1SF88_9BACT|nr:heme-binding domain-containing protein [Chitinophaga sancti]WQD59807.1 heme-binding domain-containing protein [Chitinophaga sancti]WQG88062.1 heme-binding domain-containing protein [Chitinophaga sancti]SFW83043.1 Haem-binding domain-containing protein [Chitinophaga sancti]